MTIDSARVVIWAPTGRDAELAARLLERHAIQSLIVDEVGALIDAMPDAACAIIASESLTTAVRAALAEALALQPAWSDFPILVLAPRGTDTERASVSMAAVELLGNVTLLERPLHASTLLVAVESARRGRSRQYQARDAIRGRDEFLAMLGHELRNPLAAIVLALESLENAGSGPGLKQRRIIDRQARHLARLVDDLLDVARVTTGKVTLKLAPLELGELVQRCLANAELAGRERSIKLGGKVPEAPQYVLGDVVRLEEVFSNLITNALKYSPEGSRVDVDLRAEGSTCVIEVRDTGIGIAPEMVPRVFDLFAQADSSLARSQGGLGIGLTLVRALVELHEGTINASSLGLGRGSSFTIRLPRIEPASMPAPKLALVPMSAALTVVLVDDNPDILEMTREILEHNGCTVHTASDGLQAVELIRKVVPDVALLDIGLPSLDGYGVAKRIHEMPRRPYMVALSGYGRSADRKRAVEAGFDEHLIKPITLETLLGVLARCANRQRSTRSGEA